MANRKPFCWFCRTGIDQPIEENPEDHAYIDITCLDCHQARKDYIAEIYIPLKTTVIVASRDWQTWKRYIDLHDHQAIECLSQHLDLEAVDRLNRAVFDTNMSDDTPEEEKGVSSFDLGPEEYVIVTRRLEIALEALVMEIRSGAVTATDHQLEYVLGLDLGL